MKEFTGFEEVTGECLVSCGGDSIEGHASDCPLMEVINEIGSMYDGANRLVRFLINEALVKVDDMPNSVAADEAIGVIAELKKKLRNSIQFKPSARVIHGGKRGQSDLETIVMNYGTRKAAEKLARLYEIAQEKAGREFAKWLESEEE